MRHRCRARARPSAGGTVTGRVGLQRLAEAWRIPPTPLICARFHGTTPSISVSSEKLRTVLIRTISPRTRTLLRVGATATVRTRFGRHEDFQPEQQCPADSRAQRQIALGRLAGPPPRHHRQHERPHDADYQDRCTQSLEALGDVIHHLGERLGRRLGRRCCEDHLGVPSMRPPSASPARLKDSFPQEIGGTEKRA